MRVPLSRSPVPGGRLVRSRRLLALAACALVLGASGAARAQGYEAERVEFPALAPFEGSPVVLEGLLYRPLGEGPFPALVLLHGCGGMYTRSGFVTASYRHWAELLVREGYVALLVDSFNPRGYERICELEQRPIRESRERVEDAYAALGWLAQQRFVAKERIGLLGWSNGGTGTLYAMRATQPRRGFRAAVAFYPGCRTLGRARPPYTVYAPTLIQSGELDDWTPAAPCVAMVEAARGAGSPLDIVVHAGAHHSFDRVDLPLRYRPDVRNLNRPERRGATVGEHPQARERAIAATLAFFAENLKN
jgi:dienelactone hydrolase